MLTKKKIGVLGGGQLGKMLCDAAMPWHLDIRIMDSSQDISASSYCSEFTLGSFKSYDDVMNFGKHVDILTIEIEHVNLEALFDLQKIGVKVYPSPQALTQIVDKGLQKSFFRENSLPSSDFQLFSNAREIIEAVSSNRITIPFIQKARKEGYDGRGVYAVKTKDDLKNLLDVPSVVEDLVDINCELAVITSRNPSGEIKTFDPVEMVFKEKANILDVLISPARIEPEISQQIIELSEVVIKKLEIVGVLAIEFFLDNNGKIFINEIAPRPHNSGHQTIENNIVSQYQQHLRAILDWPLIDPAIIKPAVMMNVLGEDGYEGTPYIEGMKEILNQEEVHFHWYGKKDTKPFRKMGHLTVLNDSLSTALKRGKDLKSKLKIITK